MKPKNRARLRQFDVVDNHLALIELPERVRARTARRPSGKGLESVHIMYALMIALLLRVPIRSKNLVELELGHNLIDMGKGKRRIVKIYLAESQTKNREAYEAPLPAHLYPLLDVWLKVHRLRISPARSRYLFPNPRGGLRSRDSVASQLARFIERETGLLMNVHLFRHLAAKVVLEQTPSAMETVRQWGN